MIIKTHTAILLVLQMVQFAAAFQSSSSQAAVADLILTPRPFNTNDQKRTVSPFQKRYFHHRSHITSLQAMEESNSVTSLLQNSDVWVFIAGVFPFAWATIEFWRRIAFGESFGTGKDSVVIIGQDDSPVDSRGRRVLGKGALIVAYILFTISFATLGIVVYSVISSSSPPDILPTSTEPITMTS